jgi:protein TonB
MPENPGSRDQVLLAAYRRGSPMTTKKSKMFTHLVTAMALSVASVVPVTMCSMAFASDPVPVSRNAPSYPQMALRRGVEGWVEVEFAVTSAGTVENPVVVAAQPSGVFDSAAVRAVSSWRYEPGPGASAVRAKIDFRLN